MGPQRELRNDILQLRSHYPQDASSDITDSSISSAEMTGGDEQKREQCSFCNKSFPFGTLDFHQDLCSATEVQLDGTQSIEISLVGQPLKGTPSPSMLQALETPVALLEQQRKQTTFQSAADAEKPSIMTLDSHFAGVSDTPIKEQSEHSVLGIQFGSQFLTTGAIADLEASGRDTLVPGTKTRLSLLSHRSGGQGGAARQRIVKAVNRLTNATYRKNTYAYKNIEWKRSVPPL